MDYMTIPNGGCEIAKNGMFRTLKKAINNIPKQFQLITIIFEGSGFVYSGLITHKSKDYVYYCLY